MKRKIALRDFWTSVSPLTPRRPPSLRKASGSCSLQTTTTSDDQNAMARGFLYTTYTQVK
jgi:hypothetical protein